MELIDFGARWYDPGLGRFLSPDTIIPDPTNPQSLNRYAYALGNPVKYRDPSGHWVESALDIAFISYDIYDISANGLNWENGLSLAADLGGLALPIVTGGGLVVRGIAHADDLGDLARGANATGDLLQTGNEVENVVDAANQLDNITNAGEAGEQIFKLSTKETWGRLDTLERHFKDHGADFGVQNADEYASMASEFFQKGQKEGLPTKVDDNGVIRMYDPNTNTFGAYNPDGTTRTFYKPDPAKHKLPTNMDYWNKQPGTSPWTP